MNKEPYNGLPPYVDNDTSREAAMLVMESVHTKRQRVLEVITNRGKDGATDEELEEWTGFPANTCRPRRVELYMLGKVTHRGSYRLTRMGRRAKVWVAI
jgi:hypothetical protein